jgi:hypothetical protein
MLPDVFSRFTQRNAYIKQDPIQRAKDNGYLTASLLDNLGMAIASYAILVCLLGIQMILWKILKNTKLGKYIGPMTRSRVMSGIVRTYIQISLRMNIYALLQIRYAVDTGIKGEISCVIGLSLACIYLVTYIQLFNVFIITKVTYLAVHSHMLHVYEPDSFFYFEEFFNRINIRKSLMNKLFYPLFMIRRLIHPVILISIDDGEICSSINALTTIMFLIYLLISKPYESRVENWVTIVEEGLNSVNAVLIYLLIWESSYIGIGIITKFAMISVLAFVVFMTFLSLVILVYKFIKGHMQRKQTQHMHSNPTISSISLSNSPKNPKPSLAEISFKVTVLEENPVDFTPEDISYNMTSRSIFEEFYNQRDIRYKI